METLELIQESITEIDKKTFIFKMQAILNNKEFLITIRPIEVDYYDNRFINLKKDINVYFNKLMLIKFDNTSKLAIKCSTFCQEMDIEKAKLKMIDKINERLIYIENIVDALRIRSRHINVNYRSKYF